MKVRALKKFETIRDLERTKIQGKDVYPKEGEVWETSEERAKFLLSHGVIEIVEEVKEEKKTPVGESVQPIEKVIEAKIEEVEKIVKLKTTKKKTSKK